MRSGGVMRGLLFLLCLAGGGYNVWIIAEADPQFVVVNYIGASVCFGTAAYGGASMVRYP